MKEHVLPFQNSPVMQFFQCLVFVVIEAVAIKKGSANNLINFAFTFNNSSKLSTNPLINSTIVFYSLIPTTYLLSHQKTLIRTKVTAFLTFKTKHTVIPTSRLTLRNLARLARF